MPNIRAISAILLWITPDSEKQIEQAARNCYKSEEGITSGSYIRIIRMLIKNGHEAMLEHASASIQLVTDRGITHELVRHRIASYAQESTRYVTYGNIGVIRPSFETPGAEKVWLDLCQASEIAYTKLLDMGEKPQMARSVLPTSLKTEIVMSANFREWRHVLRLRTARSAHPDIRRLMNLCFSILLREAPIVFEDIE